MTNVDPCIRNTEMYPALKHAASGFRKQEATAELPPRLEHFPAHQAL